MMKIRLGWLAALLAVALASGAHAAEDWKTYRYQQDGFSAEFPTSPVPQVQKFDPQRIIRDMQYWSDLGDIAYGIDAVLFHHRVIASQAPDKQI